VWKTVTKELVPGSHYWEIIKKKLPYSEKVFFLAVHAATRLHNWIMDSENLSYSALESPEGLFRNYY